jgi:hypothetical protein
VEDIKCIRKEVTPHNAMPIQPSVCPQKKEIHQSPPRRAYRKEKIRKREKAGRGERGCMYVGDPATRHVQPLEAKGR